MTREEALMLISVVTMLGLIDLCFLSDDRRAG